MADAYAFNPDRSKAPVYTKEEIDQYCDRSYETVSDMQSDTTLTAGMICNTLGFHAAGDGGAAWYQVTDDATANGMDIVALENGLYAELQITEAYVTPEMFGAWGDGVHDDTDAFLKSLSNQRIILDGNYLVTSEEVQVNTDIEIMGNGLVKSKANSLGVIWLSPVDGVNIKISGITINCNNLSTCGIYINSSGSTDYKINVEIDSVEIYNMQNYTNSLGTAGIYVITGSENIIINNCNIHDAYKGIDNSSVIACRFISLAYLNGNATINNCLFGTMHDLTSIKNDFDCIGINNASKLSLNNVLTISNCTFTHTFCRCVKTQGMQLIFKDNIVKLENCSAKDIIDSQYTNIIAQDNVFDLNTVTSSGSIRIFILANYQQSIIENNRVSVENTDIEDFVYLYARNVDTASNIIIQNNVIKEARTFFRTNISDTTDKSYIRIIGNITSVNAFCYLDNWTTIETVAIEVKNNTNNKTGKTAVRAQQTKLKSIYLDNNVNLREWVNLDSLDFKTLGNCKFIAQNSTASNAPNNFNVNSYVDAIIITHREAVNIEVVCITKAEGLQYGTISQ